MKIAELSVEDLIDRTGQPSFMAEQYLEDLRVAEPEIQAAFEKWWNTGELVYFSANGVTLEQLMDGSQASEGKEVIASLLLMDIIMKDPSTIGPILSQHWDAVIDLDREKRKS